MKNHFIFISHILIKLILESVLATPQLNQAQQNQSQQIQAQQYTPGNLPSHSAVAPLLTNLCDILESKVYQCPTCLTMFTGVNGKEQVYLFFHND